MGTTAAVSQALKLKQKELKWRLLQKEEKRAPVEGKPPGFRPVIPALGPRSTAENTGACPGCTDRPFAPLGSFWLAQE